jgi:hypothetical protein
MVKIRVIKTRSNNMNDILVTGNRTIDLRDNGIKKNIKLRKQARRLEIIEKIKKYFKLLAVSLGVILVVGSNLNFKIDIAQAFDSIDIEETILNSALEEQEVEKFINDIDKEYNQTREEQIRIKEQEIKLYDEETKRLELDRKKEIQKQEIEKVSVRVNLTQPKKETTIIHNEWALDDERQDWINYAYKI